MKEGYCILCGNKCKNKHYKLCYDCFIEVIAEVQELETDYFSIKEKNNEIKKIKNEIEKENIIRHKDIIKLLAIATKLQEIFKDKSNDLENSYGYIIKTLENCDKGSFQENQNDWIYNKKNAINKPVLEEFSNELTPDEEDYRKKYPCTYLCKDGHYVRSKAEREIDNALFDKELLHCYEKRYKALNNKIYYPDFYIPSLNLYIEYFGINEEQYNNKTNEKIETYLQDKTCKFAFLTTKNDHNLYDAIEDILEKIKI